MKSGMVQYHGVAGISKTCVAAVQRLVQFGDKISEVRILSSSGTHALLITANQLDVVCIKAGFASGYGGEGPRSFSVALRLLGDCGAEIDEYEVPKGLMDRVNRSALTDADLAWLEEAPPVRPLRWYDYLLDELWERQDHTAWVTFRPVIPFSIVDSRIMDLALGFFERADERLLTGYRRLEDIVRRRTGLEEHGQKLFASAFQGDKAKLTWPDTGESERKGRAGLFVSAYMAYRNPRAHQDPGDPNDVDLQSALTEFLLLNHLYRLEAEAQAEPTTEPSKGNQAG